MPVRVGDERQRGEDLQPVAAEGVHLREQRRRRGGVGPAAGEDHHRGGAQACCRLQHLRGEERTAHRGFRTNLLHIINSSGTGSQFLFR